VRKTLLLAGLLVLPASPGFAHTVGVSRGTYSVSSSTVEVELMFARPELTSALPDLDSNRDGEISAAELAQSLPVVEQTIVRGLEVHSASATCAGELEGAQLTEQDGLAVKARYRCGSEPFSIRLAFLPSLSLGHRHIASASIGEETLRAVVYEASPEFRVAPNRETVAAGGTGTIAWGLFRLGVQHILTGYDHLLFLLAIVLVGGRLRSLLVVVTAFTAAHSVTLALAALGVWAPSSRIVEPAIALSIAYVGVENWFVRDASRRWLITFPFGLIHGFGFAGAIREISLPSDQVPAALAAFNIGVEAGQVAVLLVVLPVLLWLRKNRWFADRGLKAVSAAIAVAGVFWFVTRLA
jgi:hydrogenase/urease accessory protein HupE